VPSAYPDWRRVLPAWFRVLAVTAEPTAYAASVEAIVNRYCHGQEAEMYTLACSVEALVQNPGCEG
jgi:hypothetical protein